MSIYIEENITSSRFLTPIHLLDKPPVPGERESRFAQPKDRIMNRPRKEQRDV